MIEIKKVDYLNGNIWYKEYRLNGFYHREDGPAYIVYYNNGSVKREVYFIDGLYYREDGPAIIYYDENGNITYEKYYLGQNELTEEEWFSQLSIENKLKIAFGVDYD
jgi:antitoxin component YwqK of YwqJK toxin-antitoxin module